MMNQELWGPIDVSRPRDARAGSPIVIPLCMPVHIGDLFVRSLVIPPLSAEQLQALGFEGSADVPEVPPKLVIKGLEMMTGWPVRALDEIPFVDWPHIVRAFRLQLQFALANSRNQQA